MGEKIYFQLFNYLPVALIGFPAAEVFVGWMFISLFSTFTHANVKIPLGPLKYFLNNPQMHIWHHAKSVDPRRNVNYGDALSVWDYLFGTAYVPAERPGLELGFEGVEEFPTTFWGQLVYPFREILRSIGRRLAGLAGAASV